MAEVASQTIDLVGREVSATLAEARGALESYVEQPDNAQLLETCAQQLHQVQGVLRLLEIYGAALLAGCRTGVFTGPQDAVERCVRVHGRTEPEPAWVETYADGYERFRAVYPALASLARR